MGNGRGLHLPRGAGGEAPREPATADRTLAISGRFPPRNSRRPPRASACITNWRARSLCHVPSSASCRLTLSAGFPARSDQTEALLNLPRTGLAGMRRGDAGSGRQTRSSKACRPDHRCPGTRCPGTRCPGIRCPGIRFERGLPGLVVRADSVLRTRRRIRGSIGNAVGSGRATFAARPAVRAQGCRSANGPAVAR